MRKLAVETVRTNPGLPPEHLEQLRLIAETSGDLIESMEEFGWRRIRQKAEMGGETPLSQTDVPDPVAVGAELAESLGAQPEPPAIPPPARPGELAEADPVMSRLDTETPVGSDDPGLDDERTENRLKIEIDQYRVDDHIDETPMERRNIADAREDGVERAIAAASDRGIAGPVGGHISYRESQTRSATLPYSKDSIYDADDYDPDADYDVEQPLTARNLENEAAEIPNREDDVSPLDPAVVATGEDELLAAMKRGGTAEMERRRIGATLSVGDDAASPAVPSTAVPSPVVPDPVPLTRYNPESPKLAADANWVQFHLDLNQNRWYEAKKAGLNLFAVRQAMRRLLATINTVKAATDSPRLVALLE
ncbi:hypothetical protein [Neorhodopirellula pilleata]|uniref:hypothetical protein n=1 Tax=Neorhodopirellula pilleata TaxID=2714738 RepID=UPI0011B68E7C|nr:hypothetical protein [Neorhodopirellula pilleata]